MPEQVEILPIKTTEVVPELTTSEKAASVSIQSIQEKLRAAAAKSSQLEAPALLRVSGPEQSNIEIQTNSALISFPADQIYTILKLKGMDSQQASQALELLRAIW